MTESTVDLVALRLRLTKMTDRILMRLHDRAGLPLNPSVYRPDAIAITGRSGVSLLDFALEGIEGYHASLGRYEFPDQYPLERSYLPRPGAMRLVAAPRRPDVEIPLRDELVTFYTRQLLPRLCADRDDPDTFGETAYIDADFLELLNERINVGRDVATAKVHSEPDLWDLVDQPQALSDRLQDRVREAKVIDDACDVAARYQLDPDLARFVFEWVIARTLKLEVQYLQQLRAGRASR